MGANVQKQGVCGGGVVFHEELHLCLLDAHHKETVQISEGNQLQMALEGSRLLKQACTDTGLKGPCERGSDETIIFQAHLRAL